MGQGHAHAEQHASHALIEWTPPAKRGAVVAAVQRAHFEEGRDIGDPSVLADIARAEGLDEEAARAAVTDAERLAAVRAAANDGRSRGVRGVPHVVVTGPGGEQTLNDAQSPAAYRAAIAKAAGAR